MSEVKLGNGLKAYSYSGMETMLLYKEIFQEDHYIRTMTGFWGIPEEYRVKDRGSSPAAKKGGDSADGVRARTVKGEVGETKETKETTEVTLETKLAPGATVVDVGSNIGMFAVRAHEACGGDLTLYGFEPIAPIHEIAAKNAARAAAGENGLTPRKGAKMKIFHKGLGDKPGSAEVHFHHNMSLWSTMDPTLASARRSRILNDVVQIAAGQNAFNRVIFSFFLFRWIIQFFLWLYLTLRITRTQKLTIEIDTLSNIIDSEGIKRIDFLKIDCEGNEIPVLKGIKDAHWGLIHQVVLELESFKDVKAACEILSARGFTTVAEASERKSHPDQKLDTEVSTVIAVRK